ncbi:MAG: hypothetical protein ACOX9C_11980 [Kiritimatiellia bacterium]
MAKPAPLDLGEHGRLAAHAAHQPERRARPEPQHLLPDGQDVVEPLVGANADHDRVHELLRPGNCGDVREIDPALHDADAFRWHPQGKEPRLDKIACLGVVNPGGVRLACDAPQTPLLHVPRERVDNAIARALGRRKLAVMNPGDPAAAGMTALQNQRRHDVAEVVADSDNRVRGGKTTDDPPRTESRDDVGPKALGAENFTRAEQGGGHKGRWKFAPHAAKHALAA